MPTPSRKKLGVRKSHRNTWVQDDWVKLVPVAAALLLKNDQTLHGQKMSFANVLDQAQVDCGYGGAKLKTLTGPSQLPKWVWTAIEAKKKELKTAPPAQPVAKTTEKVEEASEKDPTREELIIENQDRIEARFISVQRQLDAITTLITSVVTAPEGTKREDLAKERIVVQALKTLEKPRVLILNVNPGHSFLLERLYGDQIELNIVEQGKMREAWNNMSLGHPDHVLLAREIYSGGITKLASATGKRPVIVHGTSGVKKYLTELVAGRQPQAGSNGAQQQAH